MEVLAFERHPYVAGLCNLREAGRRVFEFLASNHATLGVSEADAYRWGSLRMVFLLCDLPGERKDPQIGGFYDSLGVRVADLLQLVDSQEQEFVQHADSPRQSEETEDPDDFVGVDAGVCTQKDEDEFHVL